MSLEPKILDRENSDDAVVVALGSNMDGAWGAPGDMLERGIDALSQRGLTVFARSRQWRSSAWPDPAGPAYLNAVCLIGTMLEPPALMTLLHAVEEEGGRRRSTPNAPRPLDLDLIAFKRHVSTFNPVLPHPRATDRLFVMGPLAELLPGWIDPVSGLTAEVLAACANIGRDAAPIG